ncbi:hypothetical protein [Maribacter aestuarii]|uniref:hypothetical protein n=1 Tax=Maribacter aestuarii TaxID=1130723 RepID=UPI00248A97E4|nr:hypothetical protein [Maribacter aestuarii]
MENLENIKNSLEKFKMEVLPIVILIKKENISDECWVILKGYFVEVHKDFDQKLKSLYAEILGLEIYLTTFLDMSRTTKEIVQILKFKSENVQIQNTV